VPSVTGFKGDGRKCPRAQNGGLRVLCICIQTFWSLDHGWYGQPIVGPRFKISRSHYCVTRCCSLGGASRQQSMSFWLSYPLRKCQEIKQNAVSTLFTLLLRNKYVEKQAKSPVSTRLIYLSHTHLQQPLCHILRATRFDICLLHIHYSAVSF